MASDLVETLTNAPLSPSELVLLYGERFTTAQILLGRTADPQVPLLHADVTVSAPQLGQAILAAALLANERAGAIRLDPRQKKQLLGLSTTDTLYAEPEGDAANWPTGSLEARIHPLATRLKDDGGQHEVVRLVAALLSPSDNPWASAVGLVIEGLRTRHLLVAADESDLQIFKPWVLSNDAKALVVAHSAAPVQQLLADFEQEHPEVWERLVQQIEQAVTEQTE